MIKISEVNGILFRVLNETLSTLDISLQCLKLINTPTCCSTC